MRARRTAVVIGVLATVAALAGCSAGHDVVAEVEGATITEADLDRVVDELGPLLADSSRGAVLTAIVRSEAGLALAEPNGVEVSSDAAAGDFLTSFAASLGIEAGGWGEHSLTIGRMQLLGQELGNTIGVEETNAQFAAVLAEADVTVSPRYGEYDPTAGGIVPLQLDWIATPGGDEQAAGQ